MKNKTFIFTKLTSAFTTYMKISFLVSISIVIPLGCWLIYLFLLKSFFNYQLQFFRYVLLSFIVYLGLSIYTVYTLLVQYLINFLLLFEKKEGFLLILLEARFDEFINFWIRLITGQFTLFLLLITTLLAGVSTLLQNFSLRIYIGGIFY
jgi:Sec-independent protein secretion pathway component TatC